MGFSGVFVPGAGIEPARVLPHWFLRPTRLPIPPSGQLFRPLQNIAWLGFGVNKGAKIPLFFQHPTFYAERSVRVSSADRFDSAQRPDKIGH